MKRVSSAASFTISLHSLALVLMSLCMTVECRAFSCAIGSSQSSAKEVVPDEVLPLIEKGDALVRAKRYDEAIVEYKAAIDKAKKPVFTAYLNLGTAYYEKGDLEAAVESFRKSTEIRPSDHRGYYNLAEALFAAGNYIDSEAAYRKVITLNPGGYIARQARHFLGLAMYKQGRIKEAIVEYRTAIEKSGGEYAEAHYNLGIALLETKDYTGAEQEFRKTIEQEKTFAEAYYNLAVSLEHQRRFREAADAFESYLNRSPDSSDTERLRAHIQKLRQQR